MRYIFILIIFIVSLTAIPILAGQEEYDDCILEHLKNAKVDFATQLIKRVCRENYQDFRSLSNKRKEYNECLLEYLPGIESLDAVLEIQKVCKHRHL